MIRKLCVVPVAALILLAACSDSNSTAPQGQAPLAGQPQGQARSGPVFLSTDPSQSLQLMKTKKDLLVVDVRAPEELREGRIDGSVLIPFWEVLKGNHNLPRNQPLLLVCAVGGRSYAVGQFLARQGYPEIYNLKGGMDAWKRAGMPVAR